MRLRPLLLAGLLAASSAAQAVTIFSDNFDTDGLGTNTTSFGGGWVVSGGTVDTIGNYNFYDFLPGNGRYIDLDGSSAQAGLFSLSIGLSAGTSYTASYSIAGNQRNYGSDMVDVNFGSNMLSHNMGAADPFSTMSIMFTPSVSGVYTLSFQNQGGDNVGALLDNVSITAVPEPGTYAMLLAGLAAVGVAARRRRQ
ncbi:PEP-CTERM sorting domain-containing protein [Oxalobacteraceae bacterium]|nr:PEP-CTERM sorting domain-containing protein [Oxalobacteraceae bacterium]